MPVDPEPVDLSFSVRGSDLEDIVSKSCQIVAQFMGCDRADVDPDSLRIAARAKLGKGLGQVPDIAFGCSFTADVCWRGGRW